MLSEDIYRIVDTKRILDGYEKLKYIQFDGASYFDSGIIPTTYDYEIETKCSFDVTAGGPNCMWGYMGKSSSVPRWLLATYSNGYLLNANTTVPMNIGSDNDIHVFKGVVFEENGVPRWSAYLDGEQIQNYSMTSVSTWPENTLSIYIGARNNQNNTGSYAGNFTAGKLEYHKVVKNGELIQYIFPYRRLADDVLCFYDLVTDTFFVNEGTGSFEAGPVDEDYGEIKEIYDTVNGKLAWQRAIPTTATPIYPTRTTSLISLVRKGKLIQDGTPTPDNPIYPSCNNGTIKCWSGNKWTAEGALVGYIIQVSTQEIVENSNYRVSAVIPLRAGDYALQYTADATGARPFTVWATTPNGDLLPDAMVWNLSRPEPGVTTGTFTLAEDTFVRISWRSTFTNIIVQPVTPSIYTDGTPEVISISGKNLFDASAVTDENRYINANTGAITTPSSGVFRYSDYIPVTEGVTYFFGITPFPASAAGMAWYSSTQERISGRSGTWLGNNNMKDTAPTEAKFVRFSIRIDEGYDTNWQNTVFFCKDGDLIEYEPYCTPQTASVDNLLSVGDYFDTQDIIDGDKNLQITHLVLTGTESGWTYNSNRFRLSIPDRLVAKIGLVCTHFEYSDAVSTTMPDKSVIMAGASDLIYFRMDSITTLDDFKDFLANQLSAGKPVILWYVLATAIETQTTPQPLIGRKNSTNIVTSNFAPNTSEYFGDISYYGKV